MNKIAIPSQSNEALYTVCLFLAQSGEPYAELGYRTWTAAYEGIANKFGIPKLSVRNIRDTFDRFTDSQRVGWASESLAERYAVIFNKYENFTRDDLYETSSEILKQDWEPMKTDSLGTDVLSRLSGTAQFAENVATNFDIKKFELTSESYVSAWGVVNGQGRTFKLSNSDLKAALSEILDSWNHWVEAELNINSVNPDKTLIKFANNYFSQGAHQVLANDQRRGFLHFISAVAFSARHDASFDEAASQIPLDKEDYQVALELVSEIQTNGEKTSLKFGKNRSEALISEVAGGKNMILYGAPGTGKSYRLRELTEDHEVISTVFHPDMQNSDFVGALKPVMEGKDITYRFSPGPFAKALLHASLNPKKNVTLLIEELNRAPAAAVFGELFLLLDRDETGAGEYEADFPNEEFQKWYNERAKASSDKIKLPSNLSIFATMNSADQGVYPLDTAFRRRWEQDYVEINYDNSPSGTVVVATSKTTTEKIGWSKFIRVLNEHLTSLGHIQEDRLIGPWFVKAAELTENTNLPGKLLIYLWDDLLRHADKSDVFNTSKITTYGMLSAAVKSNEVVFSEAFIAKLANASLIAEADKNGGS